MPETATPPNGEPEEVSDGPEEVSDEQSASADDATPDAPVFANRAERRAKGRGRSSAQPQSPGKGGPYPGARGSVQAQRQWGNRRTG
ncbi:hypothetical protein [Plantactinospora endophytica]|nr:hypothetical protein [Plantactinospora endophytica]